MSEPLFTSLAKKYNKTNAQIILRWHIQMHDIVFPRTTNPEHMHQNLDIFDFILTDEEMEEIAKLDKNMRLFDIPFEEQKRILPTWTPAD